MNRLSRVLIALFDYAVLVLASCIGVPVAVALMLWRNPELERVADRALPLAAAATGLALVLFWFGPGRRAWFAGRRWRRAVVAAAILAAGGVAGMWIRALLFSYERRSGSTDQIWACIQGAVFLLVLTGFLALRRAGLRRGWWSGRVRAGLAAALAGAVFHLGRDEPVAPIVGRNESVFAGYNQDDATYRLTLRYTPEPGEGRVFVAPKNTLRFPSDAAKRREYLLAHRAEIEANWEELAEVRAWWSEMAAHDALGDRSSWSADQPFIRFAPVRAYQQTALAMAELQALDGDGDGALARVMEVYKVGANLEVSACTLVRGMISVVVQKEALRSAGVVLDQGPVSAAVRGRLADMVAERPGAGAGIGRMLLCEALYASSAIRGMGDAVCGPVPAGWRHDLWRFASAGFRWLAFNPQATINLMHDTTARAATLAEARQLEELRAQEDRLRAGLLGGFQVKNIGGRMLISLMGPAYERIAKSYWEKEDRRAELVARLRGQ